MKKKSLPVKRAVRVVKSTRRPAAPSVDGLFDRVARILDEARSSVIRAVNHRMVIAYWLIGREIVQELQGGDERAEYGAVLIKNLSERLTHRYGAGYSLSSLKDFRLFYSTYIDRETLIGHALRGQSVDDGGTIAKRKSHAVRGQLIKSEGPDGLTTESLTKPPFHPSLSWTQYRTLMRIEKPEARQFYEQESVSAGWSTRELERQIHSFYYERLLASSDKEGMLVEQRQGVTIPDATEILKSSAVLEFLGLPDSPRLHESQLEQAIMDNLQTFLLEMGRGFSFVARQRRLVFEEDEFYVDLVFYNFLLKCFVLIDLKIGKLTHQDVGQMDSYIRLYEDLYKVPGDNPTIGLILCSEKNETIARYSVLKESQQLFATKYRLHLPSEEELAVELRREILAVEEGKQ